MRSGNRAPIIGSDSFEIDGRIVFWQLGRHVTPLSSHPDHAAGGAWSVKGETRTLTDQFRRRYFGINQVEQNLRFDAQVPRVLTVTTA